MIISDKKISEIRDGLLGNVRYFVKWILISLVIGIVGGSAGTLFAMGVGDSVSGGQRVDAVFHACGGRVHCLAVPDLP